MEHLAKPISLESGEVQELLNCLAFALVPKSFRPVVAGGARWGTQGDQLAELLVDAGMPAASFVESAWSRLAERAREYPALSKALHLLGQEVPATPTGARPVELNHWESMWWLYVAFDEEETAFSWLPNAMLEPLWDVLVANRVACPGAEDVDAEHYLEAVGDYIAEALYAFAEELCFECWQGEVSDLLLNGPKNQTGETCFDVVNRVIPQWRTLGL